ncbi:MAG: CarD family transcriptional regulator [Rhodospirillum sp.]|nr:CarD family transcriptional regulator [Rhodospirillum sp.]MCF8491092.1 CarD family transcriptional regulator [Rhodospirillum sp.]MCF8501959.1 CarD family transcriptional regulator [Rhodospirillum sp.]
MSNQVQYAPEDYVVYPTHGVGQVLAIEKQTIGGHALELLVIGFERDRMKLRIPMPKVKGSGLRRLSTKKVMESALVTLRGKARVKRTMWSRRAQEYEAKINSGDPVSIAEVVRDLYRSASQPEQSYSERQIYELALERLTCELAAIEDIDAMTATQKVEKLLNAA